MSKKLQYASTKQLELFNDFCNTLLKSMSNKIISDFSEQDWAEIKTAYLSLSIPLRKTFVDYCTNIIEKNSMIDQAKLALYANSKVMVILGMCTGFAMHLATCDLPPTIKSTITTLAAGAAAGFTAGRYLLFCNNQKQRVHENTNKVFATLLEKVGARAQPQIQDRPVRTAKIKLIEVASTPQSTSISNRL